MGRIIRPADERKLKNKNRTHSRVSGGDAQDVAGLRGTSTWAVEKRAKIKNTSTSGNPRKTILLLDKDDAITDDREQWLGEVEGFDWGGDDLTLATDHYVKQLNHRLPDYDDEEFWAIMDEDQLRSLKIQLALYGIAAHEGEQLKSLDKADLLAVYPPSTLEDQGYYKWCERNFDWYFDPEFCEHAGFEDYQRLVLRNNGEYEQWEYYRKTCNSLQGDQEYIQFWEKLSSETKWIENARYASSHVWDKLERLAFYQAMKIAAEFNNIFTALIYSGFTEYMWTIQFVNPRYEDLTCLYLEIWKRVAKQKMNLKEALKEVFESGVPSSCNVEMQVELKNQHLVTHGPVTHNYETYLAAIEENVSEEKARMLIREAVENFVSRHRTYYDYAKRKLDIARKIGLIIPSSLHEEPFMTDGQECNCTLADQRPGEPGRPPGLLGERLCTGHLLSWAGAAWALHTSGVGIGTRKHIIL